MADITNNRHNGGITSNGDNNASSKKNLKDIPTAMSTSALEEKLKELKEKSKKHGQLLTQKLASSQSGQNLLHIGTSLSTLPPDLHSLLTKLHPVLSSAEATEKKYLQHLNKLVQCGNEIRLQRWKVERAKECAGLYQDLLSAERVVKKDAAGIDLKTTQGINELDQYSSLERAAHATLCLVQDLQTSTDQVSVLTTSKSQLPKSNGALPSLRNALEEDIGRAQFLMKLAPRIRRLESDTNQALVRRYEHALKRLRRQREQLNVEADKVQLVDESEILLMIGHCMRGLALLGKGNEVENIFARVAIMPILRSRLSMGRLDEGGSRGECAGLFSLLDDMSASITQSVGPVLRLSESMFDMGPKMDVDLVTAGVWVPIATAMMADSGIRMAIFSPGIASILQANYSSVDTFVSELAERLLKNESNFTEINGMLTMDPTLSDDQIAKAQHRIYSHPKTIEFSKRWNLPIYYQLRFGECCNRLNKAIDETRREGWICNVFTGSEEEMDALAVSPGLALPLFQELYDILLFFWRSDVFLRPLTNRFLRGVIQLFGRFLAFADEGVRGKLLFGDLPDDTKNDIHENGTQSQPKVTIPSYCWGDKVNDVATVAWNLSVLEQALLNEYRNKVIDALSSDYNTKTELDELEELITAVLKQTSEQISPIIDYSWNGVIVKNLTSKCSSSLAAVKGVAANYRMTNRPPPTYASHYVGTILRPLTEFCNEFSERIPSSIGSNWKYQIVSVVAERYSSAVEELIATVHRTEVALQNRRARRAASGGMSDGDKVRLQLYLDFKDFAKHIKSVGVDLSSVDGIAKLENLTCEAEKLVQN